MTYLATLGEEAKIWEVPTFQELEQFNPFDGPITELTWSHDGHALACCCSSDTTVNLRNTKLNPSIPGQSFKLQSECLSLEFNSDSRFLLCGCSNGSLHVIDRKSKSITKTFTKQKTPLTAVRWNWNNKCIASGTDTGEIVLYNIVTAQTSSPLVAPAVQGIRQLKYNPYQKALLVAASDDGGVNLWDTNTRRLLQGFGQNHHAPARDIAFSPINDLFMVSVGLDKRLICYDLQSKKPVTTIVGDHPLTCVDVLQDGATIAVGTTRGQVFLYDMRQSSTPVYNLSAHRSSLKRLSFVRKDPRKNDASSSSSVSALSPRRHLPESFGESHIQNGTAGFTSPRNASTKSETNIFSPLAQGNKSNNNSIPDFTLNERSAENASLDRFLGTENMPPGTNQGLFSPLKADNSHSLNSTGGLSSSALMENSFLNKVMGDSLYKMLSAENSLNQDYKDGVLENDRSLHQRENASTPKQHAIQSPKSVVSASFSRQSPTGVRTSPGKERSHYNHHPNKHNYSVKFEDDRPVQIPSLIHLNRSAVISGSNSPLSGSRNSPTKLLNSSFQGAKMPSPAQTPLRYEQESPKAADTAPSIASIQTHASLAGAQMYSEAAVAGSNNNSTSSLRGLVRDLLSEELKQHRTSLLGEIRTMVTGSGVTSSQSTGESYLESKYSNQPQQQLQHHPNPEIYQAEFIRNLVRDELMDLRDWFSEELWSVLRLQIKMKMQLESMETMVANACINPTLLEEIERLREENAHLRKTF